MAHPGRRLQDSASVIDLGQLPSASPAIPCHLNHSDSALAIRTKTTDTIFRVSSKTRLNC